MPSGRDSFRRNRVAPFVLFYFTMLMVDGALAGRFARFLNCGDPNGSLLKLAFHSHVLGRESNGGRLRVKTKLHLPTPHPLPHPFPPPPTNPFFLLNHAL